MDTVLLVLGALATWRVSHMLLRENGPFEIFRTARIKLGIVYYADEDKVLRFKYEITVCVWCLSMWVGALATLLVALAPSAAAWMFLPYAFSAVTVMLDQRFGLVK